MKIHLAGNFPSWVNCSEYRIMKRSVEKGIAYRRMVSFYHLSFAKETIKSLALIKSNEVQEVVQ